MANRVSVFCCSKKYNPFILKVNSGADSQITIPTSGSGYNYDLRVQGGQSWYGLTGNHTINFPSANTEYLIEISGEFPAISFGISNATNKEKILDIVQCGDIDVKTMLNAFNDLPNCTWSATDYFNTPNCTSLNYAFYNSPLINPDLSGCDFSSVTTMRFMFGNASSADKPFIHHETSSLVDMSVGTFEGSKVPTIELGASNLATFSRFSISSIYITRFLLIGMPNSFSIELAPNILGTAIDDLANSVADMTGQTSPTITMTTAQYNSCDTSIWTNKNWTIAQV